MFWMLLFASMFLAGFGCIFYLSRQIRKFRFLWRISRRKPIFLSYAIILVPLALLAAAIGLLNAGVALLHLTLFWALCTLVQKLIEKMRRAPFKRHYAGALALLVTAAYLCAAWFMSAHVWQTDYTVTTEKPVGTLRVALIADSHLGTTFDGAGFERHLEDITAQNPDLLAVAGDFVDESTTRADMLEACRALGQLPYPVYYAFGNHDRGNYTTTRDFSGDDLIAALEENGVIILEDAIAVIDGRFTLIGRQDASEERYSGKPRADIQTLVNQAEPGTYTIVLDHQPRDYAAEAEAGADLVLSGHTHGGEFFPLADLMEWLHIGGNDKVYGYEQLEQTDFIVTSGISHWALKFRTGHPSEFVIVEIQGQ